MVIGRTELVLQRGEPLEVMTDGQLLGHPHTAVQLDRVLEIVRDPKDNIFVATALMSRADYLISEDKDLLVLGNSIGVPVIDTVTFIKLFEPQVQV